jgi:DNA-binding NarL/FixJ family response regulator
MKRMNVLLADNNPIAGRGFRGILEHQDDRELVGEAKATNSGPMGDLIENASADSAHNVIREVELRNPFFSPLISRRVRKRNPKKQMVRAVLQKPQKQTPPTERGRV